MKLSGYSFPYLPDRITPPEAAGRIGVVNTFSGAATFVHGAKLAGVRVEIEWNFLPAAQFDALDALYQGAGPLVFEPERTGMPASLSVEVERLEGSLFATALWDQPYRKDVKMTLLVVAEVAGSGS